ncbi:CCR4-Not complex caf1 ribonuclease subunit Caf1 [Orobanche minor]
MVVKSILLAPPQLLPFNPLSRTEISFSRWNNGNAQKLISHQRTQQEFEGQLRFEKRTDAALTISHNYNRAPRHPATFKSTGTSFAPSAPPISGKSSNYSKNPSTETPHPAFKPHKIPVNFNRSQNPPQLNFRIDENGISYEIPEAPFMYQYSYTEMPKVKPVKLRELLMSPFGPGTMTNPWLGRKPMPPSKKKSGFDSFQLPPSHKKGVKPVQAPGPFVPGSGPKYAKSQEEVLGEPLTKEEIEELIRGCKKSSRQLNIGRDGLTHNMLDNIHALWKRRRVCKIKCKGVCTVDMVNVCQQLE